MGQLFTIGCSILSLDDFIRNLKINKINVIADVRSIPYSRITPQFNKENLQERLRKEHILLGYFQGLQLLCIHRLRILLPEM